MSSGCVTIEVRRAQWRRRAEGLRRREIADKEEVVWADAGEISAARPPLRARQGSTVLRMPSGAQT